MLPSVKTGGQGASTVTGFSLSGQFSVGRISLRSPNANIPWPGDHSPFISDESRFPAVPGWISPFFPLYDCGMIICSSALSPSTVSRDLLASASP